MSSQAGPRPWLSLDGVSSLGSACGVSGRAGCPPAASDSSTFYLKPLSWPHFLCKSQKLVQMPHV